jgi:hypothetical protein
MHCRKTENQRCLDRLVQSIIVVVTVCFAMSAADPGLVGPTFLHGWSSVLSGIGYDDIESITRDAEKRPASVQTPLVSTASWSFSTTTVSDRAINASLFGKISTPGFI